MKKKQNINFDEYYKQSKDKGDEKKRNLSEKAGAQIGKSKNLSDKSSYRS